MWVSNLLLLFPFLSRTKLQIAFEGLFQEAGKEFKCVAEPASWALQAWIIILLLLNPALPPISRWAWNLGWYFENVLFLLFNLSLLSRPAKELKLAVLRWFPTFCEWMEVTVSPAVNFQTLPMRSSPVPTKIETYIFQESIDLNICLDLSESQWEKELRWLTKPTSNRKGILTK